MCFSIRNLLRLTLLPALLVALTSASSAFGQGGQIVITSIEFELVERINQQRNKVGLPLYVANTKLFKTARDYAKFMASRGEVSHTLDGRTPSDRAQANGYPGFAVEAIGGSQANPAQILQSWMDSKPHREGAILQSNTREVGVGNAKSADGTNVWVLLAGNTTEANNPPQIVVDSQAEPSQAPPNQLPPANNPLSPPVEQQVFKVHYQNNTGENATVTRFNLQGRQVSSDLLENSFGREFTYLPGEISAVQTVSGRALRAERVAATGKFVFFPEANSATNPQEQANGGTLTVTSTEKALFDQINQVRVFANLPALKPNAKLFTAARNHAADMVRVNFATHVIDGKDQNGRAQALGYPGMVDEIYNGGAFDAARVVRDWLEKPALAAKLRDPNFTELGVGFAISRDSTRVWNVVLGSSVEAQNSPTLSMQ